MKTSLKNSFAKNGQDWGYWSYWYKVIEFNIQSSLEYSDLDTISQLFLDKMNKNPIFVGSERDFKASTPSFVH